MSRMSNYSFSLSTKGRCGVSGEEHDKSESYVSLFHKLPHRSVMFRDQGAPRSCNTGCLTWQPTVKPVLTATRILWSNEIEYPIYGKMEILS